MSHFYRLVCLFVIVVACVAATDVPREEAKALWLRASKLQAMNLRGIHSLEGRYKLKMRESSESPLLEFDVKFAFEEGMLFDSGSYQGKSYQLVETNLEEGGQRVTREHASLGGRNGELRSRLGNGEVRVGKTGDARLLSCQLPHAAARYDFLYSLHTADKKPRLTKAQRLDDGTVRFELKSQRSGARYTLTCRPDQAFMPVVFDIWVNEEGTEKRFQTIEIENTGFRGPDGSNWYYPTSGRRIEYDQPAGVVKREWEVEVPSISVNGDVPDGRFMLKPRPDEALVRDADLKVLEPARARSQSPVSVANNGTETVESDGEPTPQFTQTVYGGGRGWWPWAGLGLGALLFIAGIGVWVRGKAA